MQVNAVCNDLDQDASVRKACSRNARFAMMQRRLRIEQVRDLGKPGVRRRVHFFRRRPGMGGTGDDPLLREMPDE